jgi:hypothetical protein
MLDAKHYSLGTLTDGLIKDQRVVPRIMAARILVENFACGFLCAGEAARSLQNGQHHRR